MPFPATRARGHGRGRLDRMPGRRSCRVLAGALVGLLAGCDVAGPSAADPVAGEDEDAVRGGPLVAALAARLADDARDAPTLEPARPGDRPFHPEARAESVELDAVLEDARGGRHVLVRRFERLAVRGPSDPTRADGEDFAFRDVARLSGAVTTSPGDGGSSSTRRRDALERITLGLAVASEDTLRVRDARLALSTTPSADDTGRTEGGGADPLCRATFTLDEGDGSALRFTRERCPTGTLAGNLALATSPTLAVRGTLVVDGERRTVTGRGWMRRAWGEPPAGGGAVVFDRLLLELDGLGLVDAARSRRRSGRGPTITTASLRRAAGGAEGDALEGAGWLDDGTAPDGPGGETAPDANGTGGVPAGWTLRAPEAGIDVVLTPIVDVPVTDDPFGRVWRGGVAASGTHTGTGFVEFRPRADRTGGAGTDTDS